MPVYLPSALTPPMTALLVAASSSPGFTRTTTVAALAWSAIACRLAGSVPLVPAFPIAACTLVMSTGVSSGNAVASASSAVATRPMIAVAMVRMGRVPSLISWTRTP
ncbi:hypothetical protein BH79_23325 [Pseudomonas aeruginosa C0324C]|nr:hypothetical protein BH79_23325 [Pseudomonas aeruginosa C0324C]